MATDVQRAGNMTSVIPDYVEEGERLTAHVLSVSGSSATLRLPDGALLHASLENGAVFEPGQNVRFLVTRRESTEATLLIEQVVQEVGAQESVLEHRAANFFHALQLTITKEALHLFERIIAAHPGIPPESAAFLAANGI